MNIVLTLKVQILILAFTVSSYGNFANANSIQFAIDASLQQQDLEMVRDVVVTVTQAADTSDSIGVIVYDAVFQRGAPIATADEIQKTRVLETLLALTPSDSSNLAAGIEKGLSELKSNGGHLIVFGHSEINVTDPEKLATYKDWVNFVLLPDAEKNGVNVVLLGPPVQTENNSFHESVTAFFQLSDAASTINNLSTVLPEALASRLGGPVQISELSSELSSELPAELSSELLDPASNIESEPSGSSVDVPVNISEPATRDTISTDKNQLSNTQLILVAMSGALLVALIAVAFLVRKLVHKANKTPSDTNTRTALDASLVAAETAAHRASSFQKNTPIAGGTPTAARQRPLYMNAQNSSEEETTSHNTDVTVKNPAVEPHDLDSTQRNQRTGLRNQRAQTQELNAYNESVTSEDLDEIRDMTRRRQESLI